MLLREAMTVHSQRPYPLTLALSPWERGRDAASANIAEALVWSSYSAAIRCAAEAWSFFTTTLIASSTRSLA